MPRFSTEEIMAAKPADPALLAATTDEAIALQIASDPDTAPDTADAPPGDFMVKRRFPEVRTLRKRLALTQEQFAARFGVNIWTLRDWENHRREPDGPAQTLLKVIDRDPEAVRLAVDGRWASFPISFCTAFAPAVCAAIRLGLSTALLTLDSTYCKVSTGFALCHRQSQLPPRCVSGGVSRSAAQPRRRLPSNRPPKARLQRSL